MPAGRSDEQRGVGAACSGVVPDMQIAAPWGCCVHCWVVLAPPGQTRIYSLIKKTNITFSPTIGNTCSSDAYKVTMALMALIKLT